jgi:hypothetical protein
MVRLAHSLARVFGRRDAAGPGRPLLEGLPLFALAVLVTPAGLAGVGWLSVAVVAGALVAVGLVRWARAAAALGRRRRAADEWLLWGATVRPSSALLSRRAAELTSTRVRSTLARSLGGIERELRQASLPGPVPLNTRALRLHVGLVRALQQRLEDSTLPVSVRGMVLADRLLTEPGSPLYSPAPDDVLAEALSEVLAALDPEPLATAA